MEPTKFKNCTFCRFYKQVFRRAIVRFSPERHYFYCTVHEKLIREIGVCESWQRGEHEFDLSPQRFDEVKKDIEWIANYLGKENS